MITVRIAELNIQINNRYTWLERLCADYITDGLPDYTVRITDDEISKEMESSVNRTSPAYAESICAYREICRRLPEYDAFVFHSSVVECDGESYAFAALSGTGKSTHTGLWLRHFGERARIINGDKPIFRFIDGELRVYGTPWCGKEGYNVNASSPLHALCFLERGSINEIEKIEPADAVMRMFTQILIPPEERGIDLLFPLLDKMLKVLPCYRLKCNISDEAVTVAYNGMK